MHTSGVRHIHLAYDWASDSEPGRRPTPSPLQNPLMDLLQAVRSAGSISGAAKALGLSYRHVWGQLKHWELRLQQPLIVWEKGQSAQLTAFADKLLWAERQAQARLAPQISALQAELERSFALAFDPGSHVLTLYASHDDALVRLREHSGPLGLHLDIRFCGSVDAIRALNEGRCTVAGFHCPAGMDRHSLLARTYGPLLQTGRHKLLAFAQRQQGWMVAAGNPLGMTDWGDVLRSGVRLVNRPLGTGTRLLLDDWLHRVGQNAAQIDGYKHEETSHAAVAAAVASGQADLGLGIASATQAHGLDFVPLLQEDYWLVCLQSTLSTPSVKALQDVLASATWAQNLGQLPGYQVHPASGQVQALRRTLGL